MKPAILNESETTEIVTIPSKLSEWTLTAISKLLANHQKENLFFDFKRQLPDPRNPQDKEKLKRDFCSFANQHGGFLILGVDEENNEIVGLDKKSEVISRINDLLKGVTPSIRYDFKTINLTTGNQLYVIHIPKTELGAHAFQKNDGFIFPKRQQGSNSTMSYEEIRLNFEISSEKRQKFQMLITEVALLSIQTKEFIVSNDKLKVHVYPVNFDITLLRIALNDTYAILSKDMTLLATYSQICKAVSTINFISKGYLTNPHGKPMGTFNLEMNNSLQRLISFCEEATTKTSELYKTIF